MAEKDEKKRRRRRNKDAEEGKSGKRNRSGKKNKGGKDDSKPKRQRATKPSKPKEEPKSRKETKWGKQQSGGGGFDFLRPGKGVLRVRIAEDDFVEVALHYVKDPEGNTRNIVCWNQEWDEDGIRHPADNNCPACRIAEEEKDDDAKAKRTFYLKAIDRKEPEEGVQVLQCGPSIFDGIKKHAEDDDWGSPTEYDIKIKGKGEGMKRRYEVTSTPKLIKPLTDEDLEAIEAASEIDLYKLTEKPTAEELSEILGIEIDEDGDVVSGKRNRRKDDDEADDADDDWGDEDEDGDDEDGDDEDGDDEDGDDEDGDDDWEDDDDEEDEEGDDDDDWGDDDDDWEDDDEED